jgi:hypothetical protein
MYRCARHARWPRASRNCPGNSGACPSPDEQLEGALTIGILPVAAVVFLAWIAIKSILAAPAAQNYSLLGFVVIGAVLLFVARFVRRSPFFQIKRENWTPEG